MKDYKHQELLARSFDVTDLEGVRSLCQGLCDAADLEYFIYAARFPSSLSNPFVLTVNGYPERWRKLYDERNYFDVDPIVRHCLRSVRPVIWDEFAGLEKNDAAVREFMQQARDHGLKSGLSVPVHGGQGELAFFSVANSRPPDVMATSLRELLPDVHLFASHLHEAVRRLFEEGHFTLRPESLTQREQDCLLWSAEGKTAWEIAQILGIAERTVVFHLHNATQKLQATTRQQAVALAIAQGLIQPRLDGFRMSTQA